MRSLFARLWLSYLLVIALTLGVAVAISFALAVRRAEAVDLLSPNSFVASARVALAGDGTDGLHRWLVGIAHGHPELQIYFVDPVGRELLNRTISGKPLPGAEGRVTPMLMAPNGVGYRMIVRRTRSFAFTLGDIFLQPAVLLVLAIMVGGMGCAWLARYLTRPISHLRASVRAVASGDLEAGTDRALAERKDEFGSLARDFDRMVTSLRNLIQSKEELLRDVSHELRSPLARLRLAAGLARREASNTNVTEFDRIDREVERLDEMIGQILRFSRLGSNPIPASELVNLTELLEGAIEDAMIEAAPSHKALKLTAQPSVSVQGDRTMLRSAIENVLRNALRFAPAQSVVEIDLTVYQGDAYIAVADAGPGVGEADAERIFEPFFRADPSNGIGLGLAITSRILALHNGTLSAANRAGAGLRVELVLPLADAKR
jgi:two-component system sensor histidine kinase CpxA